MSVDQLQYPEDLTSASQGHYVQFFIRTPENPNIKFAGGSPSSAGGTSYGAGGGKSTISIERPATKRISSSISLYMPAQVSLSQDAKYGEVEIGAVTAAAIAAYKDNIVNTFRYHMAPSFAEETNISRTFIVPSLFDIEYYYSGGQNNFLNKISTSVLESCNVTYGGERVQFFRPSTTVRGIGGGGDGAPPVETNIELQFRELEVITRERIAEGF